MTSILSNCEDQAENDNDLLQAREALLLALQNMLNSEQTPHDLKEGIYQGLGETLMLELKNKS